jgi:restriction endonuclease S subunit
MKKALLKEIASASMGHLFPSKVEHDPDGQVRVLQLRNIKEDGLDMNDLIHITISSPDAIKPRYYLGKGDILFRARYTPNVAVMIEKDLEPTIAASPIIMIRVKPKQIDPGYLVWFLNHPLGQAQIERKSRGSNLQMVNKSALADVEIDLPPMQIQQQIAEVARLQRQERKLVEEIAEKRQQFLDTALMQCLQES